MTTAQLLRFTADRFLKRQAQQAKQQTDQQAQPQSKAA